MSQNKVLIGLIVGKYLSSILLYSNTLALELIFK